MTIRDAAAWILVGVLIGMTWHLSWPENCAKWALWLKGVLS